MLSSAPLARIADPVSRMPPMRPSPMIWLIVPATLLFALFFVLPFGVLGVMSFLSGSPVNTPSVHLTLRHYERFLADDLYVEALWADIAHRPDHHPCGAPDRLPLGAPDGARPVTHRPCPAANGGDRAYADRKSSCAPSLG